MTYLGQNVEREAAPGDHFGSCASSPVPNFLHKDLLESSLLQVQILIFFLKKNFQYVAPRVLAPRIAP
jgi:hypothetical protein